MREPSERMERPSVERESATTPSTLHAPDALRSNAQVIYICPMPEHVALEYDHPGKCPLCGMTLVPVTREMLSKIQPGGRVEYYTCPMPEHSDVHSDKPGKCPTCGMTLIPVMVQPKPAPITNTSTNTQSQLPP